MRRGAVPAQLYDHHLSAATPFWVGAADDAPPHQPPLHVHNGFEVAITLAGLFEFQFGQERIAAGTGDVVLCSMWEPHQARVLDPAGNSQIVVIFLPEFLAGGPRDAAPWMRLFTAEAGQRPQVRDTATRESVLAMGRHLRDELESRRRRWQEMVRLDLLRLLLALEREWRPPRRAESPSDLYPADFTRVLPAVTLVHGDLSHRVSCTEAAVACGFSEPHFRSLFRRAMGVGFGWFSLRARLGFAAHCLAATGMPLQQIVEATGFANLSHFHRVFERHFGLSPTRYRAQSREAPLGEFDATPGQRSSSPFSGYGPPQAATDDSP